eukprot:11079907-Lingulodinium_polyedra.AAC.1
MSRGGRSVDGSASEGEASWGLAVLALMGDGSLRYLGAAWGLVSVSAPSSSSSNNAAELTAACWAAVVGIRLPTLAPVEIGYDNAQVAGALDSNFLFKANVCLAHVARVLGVLLRHRKPLFFFH